LTNYLNKFGLKKKIIAYVKDEGFNLNAMTSALKFVISFETLNLQENVNGTCFGHVFSKTCQYAIINEKVYRNLKYVSIKVIQANLQKCITWPKKSRKGGQEWTKACVEIGIHPKKLNTSMKTKKILSSYLLCEKVSFLLKFVNLFC
jgi:hypothetical protein